MSDFLSERLTATGHGNVSARHKTTLEISRDSYLTLRGDCIVAINSDKCFPGFSDEFKERLRGSDSRLEVIIECNGVVDTVVARGHASLILKHPGDMVIRKSEFICSRTLAIKSDKAALDLSRELVYELRKGVCVKIELRVY